MVQCCVLGIGSKTNLLHARACKDYVWVVVFFHRSLLNDLGNLESCCRLQPIVLQLLGRCWCYYNPSWYYVC